MMPKTEMHRRFQALASTSPTTRPDDQIDQTAQRLIDAITGPLAAGETSHAGNVRRERDVGAIFAELDVVTAWHLHRRLANPSPDDALAMAFGRFIIERRVRLLAFLADARRRAALAA